MPETLDSSSEQLSVACAIAGGGPAGMMLGYLLARAGVDVVVLEKHADFFRDFRGDTIHPSTLELMHELGILDDFLKRPHDEIEHLSGYVGTTEIRIADFTRLPTHCRYIALMPQWEFLNFLAEHARRFATFQLRMQTEATDLVEENGRVIGLRARTPQGTLEIRAALVVAADGRHSTIRERGGFEIEDLGAPMDVLWMRLSRMPDDPYQTLGRFLRGQILVLINRHDYWQCGYVIAKGGIERIKAQGLEALREALVRIAPFLRDRVNELRDWDDVKLLTVRVDRLKSWHRPMLLCIGDAAHAMSPVGGVGINLAVQDAVAAANILSVPLREKRITDADLQRVQQRREFPTRMTQRLQLLIQNRVISHVLQGQEEISVPFPLKLVRHFPIMRRWIALLIGLGVRPEHVEVREYAPPS